MKKIKYLTNITRINHINYINHVKNITNITHIKKIKNIKNKAILFTLISLLFSALFILIYSYNFSPPKDYGLQSQEVRIRILDAYLQGFEDYVVECLRISSYAAFNHLYNHLATNGFFAGEDEFNYAFFNCISCGLMNCSDPISIPCQGMADKNLNLMLGNFSSIAYSQLNILTNYSIESARVYQEYPFDVEVSLTISYNVSDAVEDNYARWLRTSQINQTVHISGFMDPLIVARTAGVFELPIVETSICKYNESCWNADTTKSFYDSQEFRYYRNGTSYLQRFWNDDVPSACCGLEHLLEVSPVGPAYGNNSYIDHYFWQGIYDCDNGATSVKIMQIDYVTPGFKLDEITLARYNLNDYAVWVCPS
jgi:hypothetical protein